MTEVQLSYGLPLKQMHRVGPAELAYLDAGPPSGPVVLLLHGFPTHAFLWRHVVHRLDERVRLLAPDLMGLGDTTVSPYEDFTAPMQAELLLDWLDGMDIAQAVLVGHEQGGAVAQQVVANHPERVRGLVLVDSAAYGNWPIPFAAHVMRLARTPGLDVLAYALDVPRRVAHNARIGFRHAVCDEQVMSEAVIDEYLRPFATAEGRERARPIPPRRRQPVHTRVRGRLAVVRRTGGGRVGRGRRVLLTVLGPATGGRPAERRPAAAGPVLRSPRARGAAGRRRRGDRGRRRGRLHVSPYEVLGVPPTATPAEIRHAYLTLARRHHPDAGGDAEQMRRLNEAWAALSARPPRPGAGTCNQVSTRPLNARGRRRRTS